MVVKPLIFQVAQVQFLRFSLEVRKPPTRILSLGVVCDQNTEKKQRVEKKDLADGAS